MNNPGYESKWKLLYRLIATRGRRPVIWRYRRSAPGTYVNGEFETESTFSPFLFCDDGRCVGICEAILSVLSDSFPALHKPRSDFRDGCHLKRTNPEHPSSTVSTPYEKSFSGIRYREEPEAEYPEPDYAKKNPASWFVGTGPHFLKSLLSSSLNASPFAESG